MSDWQPIETAPKDGTPIYACRWNGIEIVYWSPERESFVYLNNNLMNNFDAVYWISIPKIQKLPAL